MAIYGAIDFDTKTQFGRKFGVYFSFNPTGTEWMALADALSQVNNRIEFRNSFGWSQMVSMLRKMCESAGLVREDRISGEGHFDLTEGYYGLERKAGK